ncbi:PAS domain S-box-containing protein/diguanylate cyclase (GGDEF)-like protein [Paucimonas lemoignei]|uniref:PAS domain S-box-containing protein/diguanylate cyclase (GGDEF)-like protein n=1 Tax=Paucimonas lemoignei TaxID=29443 RepID=A0A4R3HYX9_PAULE|nr:EAL domain-containing protein [Paucimonas lemoignei]TCS37445.1 PAS domain S-box-containing protein/diguanylate cyclase (GGDEF)-like protein [Paucimonas lemoignei]
MENRLLSRQVDLLYQQSKGAALASAATALMVAAAVSSTVPLWLLLSWLGITVLAAGIFLGMHSKRKRVAGCESQYKRWADAFTAITALSGLCWGLCPILFSAYLPLEFRLALTVLALGISAAALPMFSVVPQVYRIFATCVAAPMLAWGILAGSTMISHELTVMAAVFLILMLVTSTRLARTLRAALRVQFDNEELVASLQEEVAIRQAAEQAALQSTTTARASQARFEHLAAVASEGLVFHENGVIINANQAFARMVGISVDALVGRSPLDFVIPAHRARLDKMLRSHRDETYDVTLADVRGREVPLVVQSRDFDYEGRRVRLAALRDITDQRAAEDKVRYLAQHDGLTGLPNRSQLLESLRQSMSLARRQKFKLGLMMFDLDRFKGINDSLGHAAGDELICAVAERLKQNLRAEDIIARPGSDEFLIMLPYVKDSQDLARTALKLQRCFEQAFTIEGEELYLTPSIGIGTYPDDGDTPEQLILRAETAMYQAKKAGGNGFAFYAAEMSALARENLNLENQLRHALDNGEFILHYQPQHDLQTNAIVGVEALIRWNRPGQGMIAPLKFIPVAEMSGLIVPIGDWVMQEACRQAQDWQSRGAEPIGVSVNVSARQFKDPTLVSKIAQCLESTGLDPHLLELELTESIVMEDPVNSAARLKQIRDLGVTISIDDFGTGYSSLSYLRQFPIDILKIDRSFVRDVHIDTHNAAIVTAILAMAGQLQIGVVAEGIETAEQQEFLARHGCGIGQGYYFNKPVTAAECEKLFERRPARAIPFSVVKSA